MSDPATNEELLIALVDGELTGEARARAEKLVTDNPQYQRLVRQWRAQSAVLRAMPRYQLGEDFTEQLMQAIESKSSQKSAPSMTHPMSHWRAGVAAMATLAALLLLTLFVFPRGGGVGPTISKLEFEASSGKAEDTAAELKQFKKSGEFRKLDAQPDLLKESLNGDTTGNGFRQSFAPRLPAPMADESASAAEPSAAQPATRRTDSFESAKSQVASERDMLELESSKPTALAGSAATKDKNAALVYGSQKTAGNKQLSQTASPNQQPVSQVFVVEFAADAQPLATVEKIFLSNQIHIQGNEVSLNESADLLEANANGGLGGAGASPNGRTDYQRSLNRLTQQSASDMEALYVVSTAAQMQQAIQDLSNMARISGFDVPLQETSRLQESRELWEWDQALPGVAQGSRFNRGIDSKTPLSSAQQLRLYSNNQTSNDQQRNIVRDRKLNQDNFFAPADSPLDAPIANQAIELDAIEVEAIAGVNNQPEMVQYLLLVRTVPAAPEPVQADTTTVDSDRLESAPAKADE